MSILSAIGSLHKHDPSMSEEEGLRLALQFDHDHIEGLVANVLRQMNLGSIRDDSDVRSVRVMNDLWYLLPILDQS